MASSTQIGGLPIGFTGEWPKCRACGHAMEFLLHFDLARPLALSESFSLAYLFVCPHYENYKGGFDGHPCPTWDATAGANALILQSAASKAVARKPRGIKVWPQRFIEFSPYQKEPEDAAQAGVIDPAFLKSLEKALADAPPEAEEIEIEMPEAPSPRVILIGGDPQWLQSPQRPKCPRCKSRMNLLCQVDAEVGELNCDEDYYLPFGSGGVGYLFACEKECDPTGAAFLWQST